MPTKHEVSLDRPSRMQFDKLVKSSERQAKALERIAQTLEDRYTEDHDPV